MRPTSNSRKAPKNGLKTAAKPATTQTETRAAAPVRELKAAEATQTLTTIEAKIDVGFGNQLYARGEGAGLSWERGTPLKCVDPQTWQLTVEAKDPLKFKLLLNDAVWMAGEDIVAPPGQRIEIRPAF
jgi:hypothetical protein